MKLPIVKVEGGEMKLYLRALSIHEQLLISVLLEAKGGLSVVDICNKMGWNANLISSICLGFVEEVPDMIEFHNIPEV